MTQALYAHMNNKRKEKKRKEKKNSIDGKAQIEVCLNWPCPVTFPQLRKGS
jgi:hypothetical protein